MGEKIRREEGKSGGGRLPPPSHAIHLMRRGEGVKRGRNGERRRDDSVAKGSHACLPPPPEEEMLPPPLPLLYQLPIHMPPSALLPVVPAACTSSCLPVLYPCLILSLPRSLPTTSLSAILCRTSRLPIYHLTCRTRRLPCLSASFSPACLPASAACLSLLLPFCLPCLARSYACLFSHAISHCCLIAASAICRIAISYLCYPPCLARLLMPLTSLTSNVAYHLLSPIATYHNGGG